IVVLRKFQLPWDEAQALECWGTALIKAGESKLGDRRLDAAVALYRRHGAGRQWLQRLARLRARVHHGYAPRHSTGDSRIEKSKCSAWWRRGRAIRRSRTCSC